MRNPAFLVFGGLIALAAILVFGARESADAGIGDGDRVIYRAANIGTVDIEDLIDDYAQRTGAYEALRTRYLTKRRALSTLKETVDSMAQELEIFPRGSEEHSKLYADIQTKQAQLKFQSEADDRWYDQEQAKLASESYEKIVGIIERVAGDKGLDLVLMQQSGKVAGRLMSQVSSSIVVRSVVFAKTGMDITEDVKKLL
ncbi:MAG: OmpH family outer membrane protein [Planctomycetota bacterium]